MHTMPGKKVLYTEREKIRHTTHWDLDYLPIEAVERSYLQASTSRAKKASRKKSDRSQRWLGLVLLAAGVVLFACAVLLGRYFTG
jgi:hypothetical protein